jgi:hypothetical protein
MSLPSSQLRVLGSIEGRLRAADPHLASMFAIFADTTAVKAATGARPTTADGTENPACIALIQHGRSARGWVCYK